jgi:hypothetical protein
MAIRAIMRAMVAQLGTQSIQPNLNAFQQGKNNQKISVLLDDFLN